MVATVVVLGLSALPSAAQDPSSTVAPSTTSGPPTTAPVTTSPESSTSAPAPTAPESTGPAAPTTLSKADRRAKAAAAGKLNAAVAADSEIAAGLQAINEVAQDTQSRVDEAQRSLEAAKSLLATSTEELATASVEQAAVEVQLRLKAVEGFKSGVDGVPSVLFTDHDMNDTIRQTELLHQANKGTAELLEELRQLKDDQLAAQAEATQAQSAAESLGAELSQQLDALEEQQKVQLALKREAESRISKWETELNAYASEDQAIQDLINSSSPAKVSLTQLRPPSNYGFQWPVAGVLTSEYGYRIHPVYGTRKLHSGLDVSAPQGTNISAAASGVVLSAGVRGGYGNCVIIDHGDGVSTLYGHMSRINLSAGQTVARGDSVGLVGQTGTATGNHLHFEVRVNGEPTNPRPYLPATGP
jgi:murein DD-endopeptidase MepM/ murein hydrolase activator NlpD